MAQGFRDASVSVATMRSSSRRIKTAARRIPARTLFSVMIDDQWPIPKRWVKSSATAVCSAATAAASAGSAMDRKPRIRGDYSVAMNKGRLEAFSDGVFAVIITIMVLELRVPHGDGWTAARPLLPVFFTYILSYVFLGIYWNNHHHLLHASDRIDGTVLWANLHLLFWLSLVPFVTGWMGENHFAALPTAVYGCVLLMAGVAFLILELRLLRAGNQRLAAALGSDRKGKISAVLYLVAIPLAFVNQAVSDVIYVCVALVWLVPDSRIERTL